MKCEIARGRLSVYHDGELPADQRAALEVHLENCPRCAAELAELRRLSELASKLEVPPPASVLSRREPSRAAHHRVQGRQRPLSAAIAALSVVATAAAVVVGITAAWSNLGHHDHGDLARYWESFQADPLSAQERFVTRYGGRVVSADQAVGEVGFRPLVATHVPNAIRVETNYALEMPCCKCIETICRRDDGTALAVFEHQDKDPGWFPGRAQVSVRCGGTTCRVTELHNGLAASWPLRNRTITVVGLRDVDELSGWVRALCGPRSASHGTAAS